VNIPVDRKVWSVKLTGDWFSDNHKMAQAWVILREKLTRFIFNPHD
jgi:hypothetical protein